MRKKRPEGPSELTWSAWPARQRPAAGAAVVLLILGVSWYGYVGFGHVIYSIVALVALTGSLTFFLFPTTHTLDREGIKVRGFLHRRQKAWGDLACFVPAEDVILVSTADPPTKRTVTQGFVLRLSGNRAEVVAFLARHLPEWKRPEEGSDAE